MELFSCTFVCMYIQIYDAYTDHLVSSIFLHILFWCILDLLICHSSLSACMVYVESIIHPSFNRAFLSCPIQILFRSRVTASHSYKPTHHHQRIYHHTHFSSLYLNDNIALSYQSKFSSSIIDIHLIEKNSFVQLVIQMLLHMLAIKHRQLSWLK